MLWDNYIFERGDDVRRLWIDFYGDRSRKFVYITGRGFDLRANIVLEQFIKTVKNSKKPPVGSKLLIINYSKYKLDNELENLVDENHSKLVSLFEGFGEIQNLDLLGETPIQGLSTSASISHGMRKLMPEIEGYSDIVLDISTLPRIVFLTIATSILGKIVDKNHTNPLGKCDKNFQIIVAEDPSVDSAIASEEPSNEVAAIPGFRSIEFEVHADKPLIWFPILGENRANQLQIVMSQKIRQKATNVEICPVLPFPTVSPRRGDKLILEYKDTLFRGFDISPQNILYAHEGSPFECYRQLFSAMKRYSESFSLIGGCNLVVTPMASKLITLGAALACFDMIPSDTSAEYGVSIPYVEPKKYVAKNIEKIKNPKPILSNLMLTGEAYHLD